MQVTMNVGRFVTYLQTKLYTETTTVVDELVQNAMRAGATIIEIECHEDRLTVTDNGKGVDDWDSLLCLAESGWGDDVEAQDPFGMGFWSVATLAKRVVVISNAGAIAVDIEKMLRDQTLDGIVTNVDDRVVDIGTTVEVSIREDAKYSKNEFCRHIQNLSRFLDVGSFKLNGVEVETKQGYLHGHMSAYAVEIDSGDIQGTILPQSGYSWGQSEGLCESGVLLVFQGRPVMKLGITYAKGVLHVGNDVITPRAPDRKDVVRDDKWYALVTIVEELRRQALLLVLKEFDPLIVRQYEDALQSEFTQSELKELVRFEFDAGLRKTDQQFNQKTLPIPLPEPTPEQVTEAEQFNADQGEIGSEIHDPAPSLVVGKDDIQLDSQARPIRKKPELRKFDVGVTAKDMDDIDVFWVPSADWSTYADVIELARYHGMTVAIVRNKVERKVAESLDNWRHIAKMQTLARQRAWIENRDPQNDKETRMMWLLAQLSKKTGVQTEMGDLAFVTFLEGYEKGTERDGATSPLGMAYDGLVFINRSEVWQTVEAHMPYIPGKSNRLTKHDLRALLLIVPTLAHEYAHVLFGTEDTTTQHESATQRCYAELIDVITKWM